MSNHHHKKPSYDDMEAMLAHKLSECVATSREFRAARQEQFGHIDQYRVVRDQAESLIKLSPTAMSMLLATAIDRLAQLPDPVDELEALLDLDAPADIPEQEGGTSE